MFEPRHRRQISRRLHIKNEYEIRGDTTCIFIWSKGVKYECLVDTAKLELVHSIDHTLGLARGYVVWRFKYLGKGITWYIHRVIMDAPSKLCIDHINRNPLDNRMCNLRLATHGDNKQNNNMYATNTSGATGVYFNKPRGKWVAYIRVDSKLIYLGLFSDFNLAIKTREAATIKYHPYFDPTADHYKEA